METKVKLPRANEPQANKPRPKEEAGPESKVGSDANRAMLSNKRKTDQQLSRMGLSKAAASDGPGTLEERLGDMPGGNVVNAARSDHYALHGGDLHDDEGNAIGKESFEYARKKGGMSPAETGSVGPMSLSERATENVTSTNSEDVLRDLPGVIDRYLQPGHRQIGDAIKRMFRQRHAKSMNDLLEWKKGDRSAPRPQIFKPNMSEREAELLDDLIEAVGYGSFDGSLMFDELAKDPELSFAARDENGNDIGGKRLQADINDYLGRHGKREIDVSDMPRVFSREKGQKIISDWGAALPWIASKMGFGDRFNLPLSETLGEEGKADLFGDALGRFGDDSPVIGVIRNVLETDRKATLEDFTSVGDDGAKRHDIPTMMAYVDLLESFGLLRGDDDYATRQVLDVVDRAKANLRRNFELEMEVSGKELDEDVRSAASKALITDMNARNMAPDTGSYADFVGYCRDRYKESPSVLIWSMTCGGLDPETIFPKKMVEESNSRIAATLSKMGYRAFRSFDPHDADRGI